MIRAEDDRGFNRQISFNLPVGAVAMIAAAILLAIIGLYFMLAALVGWLTASVFVGLYICGALIMGLFVAQSHTQRWIKGLLILLVPMAGIGVLATVFRSMFRVQ